MQRFLGPVLIGFAVGAIVAAVQVTEPLRLVLMIAGMIGLGFGVREVGRMARRQG